MGHDMTEYPYSIHYEPNRKVNWNEIFAWCSKNFRYDWGYYDQIFMFNREEHLTLFILRWA